MSFLLQPFYITAESTIKQIKLCVWMCVCVCVCVCVWMCVCVCMHVHVCTIVWVYVGRKNSSTLTHSWNNAGLTCMTEIWIGYILQNH